MIKICVLDIETSPNVGTFWRCGYNITLTPDNITKEREVLSVVIKEFGKKKFYKFVQDGTGDKKLLVDMLKCLEQFDHVIAHNGDKFDIPWLNGRIMYHRLDPMPMVKVIDTYKLARSSFSLNSYKLDYLGKFLGVGQKVGHSGYELWLRCLDRDKKAFKELLKYNVGDVVLNEDVYREMIHYIPHHKQPFHTGVLMGVGKDVCSECGSADIVYRGMLTTKVNKYPRYKCKSCGHWGRAHKREEILRKEGKL